MGVFWDFRFNLLIALGLGVSGSFGYADTPAEPDLAAMHAAVEAGDDLELTIPTLETLTPSEMGPELGEYALPTSHTETYEAAEALIAHFRETGQADHVDYRSQTMPMVVRADIRLPQKSRFLCEHLRRAYSSGENVPFAQIIRINTGANEKEHRKKYRLVRLLETSEQMLLKFDHLNGDLPKLGLSRAQFEKEVKHKLVRIFAGIGEYFGAPIVNLTRGVRYHLGAQRPISLAMYRNETTGYRRPLSQKAVEVLGIGSFLAAFTGIITYYSNSDKSALYPAFAALNAGCFQFFWSYFERANSALRTYGMSYRHDLKGFDVNSKMYYLTQFALSLPSALTTTWALHGGIGWAPSIHAVENAAIGTFARRWISVYIGRHQNSGKDHLHSDSSQRHSPRTTFLLNMGSIMFVTWIRNSHLAGWDSWLSLGSIYALMAVGDIIWEGQKHFTARLDLPRISELLRPEGRVRFKRAMGEVWKRFAKKDIAVAADAVGLRPLPSCSTSLYLLSNAQFEGMRAKAVARGR